MVDERQPIRREEVRRRDGGEPGSESPVKVEFCPVALRSHAFTFYLFCSRSEAVGI